jgi:hypothetical protein
MNDNRKGLYRWMPSFTANGMLYVGMWAAIAVISKPDFLYWLPPLVFLLFMFSGHVIRPNHLIPLIPWFATAGLNPAPVIALVSVDTVSAGFYLGDIWNRFYPGLRDVIKESREIGNWIKNKSGLLWVNSMHSEIYTWSGKPPMYGMTEQIEIASVAEERRRKMRVLLAKNQPNWIVTQPGSSLNFDANGYHPVARSVYFVVYGKDE